MIVVRVLREGCRVVLVSGTLFGSDGRSQGDDTETLEPMRKRKARGWVDGKEQQSRGACRCCLKLLGRAL